MFKNIEINYFKCFESLSLNWKKLNLVTGENSAGKSSVIQAVLLFAQAMDYSSGNLLNGRYEQLGQIADIKNIYRRGQININAEADDGSGEKFSLTYDEKEEKWNYRVGKMRDIIYLSAERIGVQSEYNINIQQIYRIGVQGEFAFDFLGKNKHENLREPQFLVQGCGANLGNQVDYWLNYITGYTVSAEAIEGTTVVKVSYRENNSTKEIRPCHVGTGISYIAGVIIAALSCTKQSLFMVENPEIHLHPGAQSRFVEFFAFLAARGLQVIIETHSDHVINGVRKAVKKKKILSQDVAIYFLKKNRDNISQAVEMRTNDNGVIINQERGFFDQLDDDLDILLGFDEYE